MRSDVGGGPLDARVARAQEALAKANLPAPALLIASSTGTARLAAGLRSGQTIEWSGTASAPGDAPLACPMTVGLLGGVPTWIVDVAVDDVPGEAPGEAEWTRAFPIWLAAAAGARYVIHTCAGTALGESPRAIGAIARISDHMNLSGRSPLTGLGQSKLGPLFPDQTRVHDPRAKDLVHRVASARGVETYDAVAACTIGPALATPAEFRWYRAAGGDIAVQGLADPLVASAHAGLTGLTLCAITDRADESVDVVTLVGRTAEVAPALDALVLEVAKAVVDAGFVDVAPGDDGGLG